MTAARWLAIALFAGAMASTGCKKENSAPASEPASTGATVPSVPRAAVPVGEGSVSGTVTFEGKPPAKILIDTTMDPACAMASSAPVYTEQYAVKDGKLANVFVYVKSGPPAAMQTGVVAAPVVLDQKGCQYIPHVIAVEMGGTVEFRNSDVTMHNIHTMPAVVGNETIDISEGPRGTPVVKQFKQPENMIPVRCNNHPWMNAFINVAPTPFFGVTDDSGHFDLKGLPPGDYTIGAVHEKLGEQDMTVTVTAKGAAKAAFRFGIK